jgi:hypothetical protein
MASKIGNAAAAEARGVPEFDPLASTLGRENNSASAQSLATPIVVTIRGPAVAKARGRESPTHRRRPENTRPTVVWPPTSLWAIGSL